MKPILIALAALLVCPIAVRAQDKARLTQIADFVFASGSEVDTLDPQQASWLTDFRVIECMFEPLLIVNPKTQKLEPAAAEKWEVSDDKLTYTFHIRKDAKWSNGDDLTAGDFIYAWRRGVLPDFYPQYATIFHPIKGVKAFVDQRNADLRAYRMAENRTEAAARVMWDRAASHWDKTVGVVAKDDKTLIVTLEKPVTYFLELVAFPSYAPVHRKSVEPTVTVDGDTGFASGQASYFFTPGRIVGNGAYELFMRQDKKATLLTANPEYWNRAAMGNTSILIRVIVDPDEAMREYEAGKVHWLADIPSSTKLAANLVAERDAGKRKDVHTGGGAGTYFYHFNCNAEMGGRKNPFADARVRRAFALAIDRKAIVTKVTRLNQPIATTMTPAGLGMAGYEPPVDAGAGFDPAAARKLLAEAGYPGGKGFPDDVMISFNTGSQHYSIAEAIAEGWKAELGVEIELAGVDNARAMEIRRNAKFHIARGGWYGDYRDPTTFLEQLTSNHVFNNSKYSSKKYDALYAKAQAELDVTKRNALLREAEAVMLADQPIAPIYQYVNLNVFDPDVVEHLDPNPWNYRRLWAVKVTRK